MNDAGDSGIVEGDGYAVANIDDLGDGPGFRKIRKGLGLTAFGANALVLPSSYVTGRHFHEIQEELYFLHRGSAAIEFGDDSSHELAPGGGARVDSSTVRGLSTSATQRTRWSL